MSHFVAFCQPIAEAAHANRGANKIDEKSLREGPEITPSEPKSSQNRQQICPGGLRSDLGRFGASPGRPRDAPETVWDALGTPRDLSGRSRDAPGDLRHAPGTLSGRSGTLLGRLRDASGPLLRANCSRNRLRIELGSFFRRFFEVFSLVSRIVFRSCFPQFFDRFSIGLRPFFDRSRCRESCERLLPDIDFCAHGQCFGRFFQIRASSSDRKTMSGATENRLPN